MCWRDVIEWAINAYGTEQQPSPNNIERSMKNGVPIHAYRLVYPYSPNAPEMLWEWDKVSIARLLWNATAFGRELAHQYFPTWNALAEANQRIWETDYLPRGAYEPWESWQVWMDAYREIVRDAQALYEECHGRMPTNRRHARQEGS
jgi:hypothetical protein